METSLILLQFVPPALILVLANLEDHSPAFRWLTYIALALLNLVLLAGGLVAVLVTNAGAAELSSDVMAPGTLEAMLASARAMAIVGLLGFLPFLPPLRALLARVIPINPNSTVHMTALVFAIYVVGLGVGQQPLLTDPDVLAELDLDLGLGALWAQGLGMLIVALPGVGAFLRRNRRQTAERLGLAWPTLRDLGLAVGAVGALTLLQMAFTPLWQTLDPAGFARLDEANSLLLGQFVGLGAALTIGLSAAVGEELVFRGALQPRFGFWLTAILFTVVHSQYGFTLAALLIFLIALVLGLLRRRTNLTVCILVHFGFNFLSVLLASVGQ